MAFRDHYELEPLHIRAYLRTNVVADRWLPLDGVLLYQAHRNKDGPRVVTIPGEYTQKGVCTLPLGIVHPGRRDWYYQCSWAQWSHDVEGTDYWNKRFDTAYAGLIDFGNRRGKVLIGQGQYKAYHMPIFYRSALWIEWYCVGDKAEIEYLLSTLTHLGKKASQGYGGVINWVVESWHSDWSVWQDDKLMRGIPAKDVCDAGRPFNLAFYGIRPSYWKKGNQKMLAMPE